MKYSLFALLLVLGGAQASANDLVEGYMITFHDDTVRCRIKMNDLDLFDSVHIIDSMGMENIYPANNPIIRGFGFIFKKNRYDYVAKANEAGRWQFLLRMISGYKLNLYYSFPPESGVTVPDHRISDYLIEDSTGRVVSVDGGLFHNYKKRIREFLKGDPALRSLFNNMVIVIPDIPKFVRAANR
jgi:hypothetical protein